MYDSSNDKKKKIDPQIKFKMYKHFTNTALLLILKILSPLNPEIIKLLIQIG